MTLMSGASDKSVFDGNTVLRKISEEYGRHRYVYFGGVMICCFLTNDNTYNYLSNMENNLNPYSVAVGHEDIIFLTAHLKFIK